MAEHRPQWSALKGRIAGTPGQRCSWWNRRFRSAGTHKIHRSRKPPKLCSCTMQIKDFCVTPALGQPAEPPLPVDPHPLQEGWRWRLGWRHSSRMTLDKKKKNDFFYLIITQKELITKRLTWSCRIDRWKERRETPPKKTAIEAFKIHSTHVSTTQSHSPETEGEESKEGHASYEESRIKLKKSVFKPCIKIR